MGETLEADFNDTAFPLTLVIDSITSGPLPGQSPTVAVRLAPTTNSYLDWTTLTFKVAGWGVKFLPMTDLSLVGGSPGVYQAILDVAGLGFTPKTGLPQKLIAEYQWTGVSASGVDADTVMVSELRPDSKVSRMYNTNRLETVAGSPNGQLNLYDDNGALFSTQTVNDGSGGGIATGALVPAKRSSV